MDIGQSVDTRYICTGQASMDMDISMDIHAKSVDVYMDMDGKFHIHGNPANSILLEEKFFSVTISEGDMCPLSPSLYALIRIPFFDGQYLHIPPTKLY